MGSLCCSTESTGQFTEFSEDEGDLKSSLHEALSVRAFELQKVIGKGASGKVMLVKKKGTGEVFAMKVLRKQDVHEQGQKIHVATEREVMEKIKNPFLVQMFYAFQSGHKLYFILEYCNGGDLFHHLRRERKFSEDRARFYASEIILGLECLHANNVIYRDLKPENLLLDQEGHIKIADFGLSKKGIIFNKKKAYTFCGTPEYLAPEIVAGEGHNKAVDWWSMGCLIFEMLEGRSPFWSSNRNKMLRMITNTPVQIPPRFSEEAKSLLEELLTIDPKKRLGGGPKDAQDIKMHPFFEQVDWEAINQKRIKPPFKPLVSSEDDTRNVDRCYLREEPKDTPAPIGLANQKGYNFEGFTYYDQRLIQPSPHFSNPKMTPNSKIPKDEQMSPTF